MHLTARAERELSRITGNEIAHHSEAKHTKFAAPQLSPAIIGVLSVMFVLVSLFLGQLTPTISYAASPQLLDFRPIEVTSQELLEKLSEKAAAFPLTSEKFQTIRVQAWNMSITKDSQSTRFVTFVMPEQYKITRKPDGSLSIVVRAGQPVDNVGNPLDVTDEGIPPVGTLIWSDHFPADSTLFPGHAPVHSENVDEFLKQGMGIDVVPDTAEYFGAVRGLLMEQYLNGAQNAALLRFLSQLPNIRVAGSVVDRLGREGIAIATTRYWLNDEISEYIIISPQTGRILAVETVNEATTTHLGQPGPIVTGYHAWER
jgi:hypothetical protein